MEPFPVHASYSRSPLLADPIITGRLPCVANGGLPHPAELLLPKRTQRDLAGGKADHRKQNVVPA